MNDKGDFKIIAKNRQRKEKKMMMQENTIKNSQTAEEIREKYRKMEEERKEKLKEFKEELEKDIETMKQNTTNNMKTAQEIKAKYQSLVEKLNLEETIINTAKRGVGKVIASPYEYAKQAANEGLHSGGR